MVNKVFKRNKLVNLMSAVQSNQDKVEQDDVNDEEVDEWSIFTPEFIQRPSGLISALCSSALNVTRVSLRASTGSTGKATSTPSSLPR